jgi:hypothetical protein
MDIRTKSKIIEKEGLAFYAVFFESERIKQTQAMIYRKRMYFDGERRYEGKATLLDVTLDKKNNEYIYKEIGVLEGAEKMGVAVELFHDKLKKIESEFGVKEIGTLADQLEKIRTLKMVLADQPQIYFPEFYEDVARLHSGKIKSIEDVNWN